jgi:hypothetical protein
MRRFSVEYIDELLAGDDYGQLAQLSSILCASAGFSSGVSDLGLPQPALLFVEALCWFAQALRSGAWTYYEATPLDRQEAVLSALRAHAPPEFGEWYEYGLAHWESPERMQAADEWIEANEGKAERWLRDYLAANRAMVIALTA